MVVKFEVHAPVQRSLLNRTIPACGFGAHSGLSMQSSPRIHCASLSAWREPPRRLRMIGLTCITRPAPFPERM